MAVYEERELIMAREDDWHFEAGDFVIPKETDIGRQFLHGANPEILEEGSPAIIFQGKLKPLQNTNTEKTGPPELLLRISKDKAIELAHRILKEWE